MQHQTHEIFTWTVGRSQKWCNVQENYKCPSCYHFVFLTLTSGWFVFCFCPQSFEWSDLDSEGWDWSCKYSNTVFISIFICIIYWHIIPIIILLHWCVFCVCNNCMCQWTFPCRSSLSLQIFIDRDPSLFAPILNFLRTKELHPRSINVHMLMHEAEFYGITPLGETQKVWVHAGSYNDTDRQFKPAVWGFGR